MSVVASQFHNCINEVLALHGSHKHTGRPTAGMLNPWIIHRQPVANANTTRVAQDAVTIACQTKGNLQIIIHLSVYHTQKLKQSNLLYLRRKEPKTPPVPYFHLVRRTQDTAQAEAADAVETKE